MHNTPYKWYNKKKKEVRNIVHDRCSTKSQGRVYEKMETGKQRQGDAASKNILGTESKTGRTSVTINQAVEGLAKCTRPLKGEIQWMEMVKIDKIYVLSRHNRKDLNEALETVVGNLKFNRCEIVSIQFEVTKITEFLTEYSVLIHFRIKGFLKETPAKDLISKEIT